MTKYDPRHGYPEDELQIELDAERKKNQTLQEALEKLCDAAVSTRVIVADHIGGTWDTTVSHGYRKLGHNPSWVKTSDIRAALASLASPGTERPNDPTGTGRLLLNAYGRECYNAGRESVLAAAVVGQTES